MGRPQTSNDAINRSLSNANLRMIGEFTGRVNDKHTFECSNGHVYTTRLRSILNGHGCGKCQHDRRILSRQEIEKRIEHTGITIVSEYVNTHTSVTLRCNNGHTWTSIINVVLKGHGCKKCAIDAQKMTKDEIDSRLSHRDIKMIGEYHGNSRNKQQFVCANKHIWRAELTSVLRGHGCRLCSASGFKTDRPAHAYIIKFNKFCKYGISNRLPIRLREHMQNGSHSLVYSKFFENGADAENWERAVKNIFGGYYATKNQCPNGWTETLSLDHLLSLVEHLKEFKS